MKNALATYNAATELEQHIRLMHWCLSYAAADNIVDELVPHMKPRAKLTLSKLFMLSLREFGLLLDRQNGRFFGTIPSFDAIRFNRVCLKHVCQDAISNDLPI